VSGDIARAVWTTRCVASAIAIASSLLAYSLTGERAIGLHDEGLYLATARALADSGEYRLINLPSAPPQTKYPPAYPAALALTGRALGVTGMHVRPLKIVNAVSLLVIVVCAAELARRLTGGSAVASLAAALLTGSSQGLVTHVDVICSDLMFIGVLLGALLVAEGARRPAAGSAAGILLGLAIVTRTIGATALVGTAITPLGRGRQMRVVIGPGLIVALGWVLWCRWSRAAVGPLEQYYVVYERFVWMDAVSAPAFAWRVVSANASQYLQALPWALGAPEGVTALALAAGAALGAWRVRRHVLLGTIAGVGVCYALVLLAYPAVFPRYLLPVIPVAYALVASGLAPQPEHRNRSLAALVSATFCALLLTANIAELRQFAAQPGNRIHTGFGRYLPFGESGFLQTAEWIRGHTPVDARLGSANDTAYFTLTGRRGVRPWPHEPESYNPAYGHAPEAPAVDVPTALERIGVHYVIVDPYLSDAEGAHAARYTETILHAPGRCWQLVFTSDDGLHRIYQQSGPAGDCAAGQAPVALTPAPD
jgi:hypothetical protein